MAGNGRKFTWTKPRLQAAQLTAESRLTEPEIAAKLEIGERTLRRWKLLPEFAAKVQEIRQALEAAILAKSIGNQQARLAALDDRWQRMQAVIEARANDPENKKAAGGHTGLVVKTLKGVAGGVVDEYAVDTGLLRELREAEKQAAQERGQWKEQHEHTGKDGGPIEYRDVSDAELDQRIAEREAQLSARLGRKNPPASVVDSGPGEPSPAASV